METAQAIMTLIGTGIGILATGIPLIITLIKLFTNKNKSQIWAMIQQMADAAITAAEQSGRSGAEKKEMVINAVVSGLKSQGIDIEDFKDQLSAYIDECIKFVNNVSNK